MKKTSKTLGISCSLLVVLSVSLLQIYSLFNLLTDDKGPLLFFHNTLMHTQTTSYKETLAESITFKMQDLFNPIGLFYTTMPYYKRKSIVRGVYQEELGGYFEMPPKDEFVTLDTEVHTIQIPEIKKQTIERENLSNYNYLRQNILSGQAAVSPEDDLLGLWDFEALADRELKIDDSIEGPKVLIFHTHIKEAYVTPDKTEKVTVADVAEQLEKILEEEYGLETLHVLQDFYPSLESADTTGNYERIEDPIQKVLEDNPSIQIVIDLHRDGIQDHVHLVGEVDGQPTAKMMIASGLCMSRNSEGKLVPMKYLQNPYLEDNLAFALQMQLAGLEYYPEMMRKMYLMAYRYSTHMKPYSILIELGAQTNTAEEAMNAVGPIAHMIGKVFQKD